VKRIVVQAGHMQPLQPGFEGDTGAKGEAELVADIQRALVRLLSRDDNFHGIPIPGRIDDSVQCDAAIFLHADGVTDPSANGFSVGFPEFDVNRRLAHLIAEEIEKLPGHPRRRPDNGTADMAEYYGFRHIQTPGPEVLVEHGFVTNPGEHEWLKDHVGAIAQAELNALRRFFGFAATAPAETRRPASAHGAVTVDSALLAAARAPAPQAVRHLLSRAHGEYTDGDVQAIVGHYYATAPAVGLDPLLVVAQMVEETEHLTSFWSQRPRRNPAGIGVTGAPGVGLSFPDWKTAVRAHTGRLLAYVLPKDTGDEVQGRLIEEALAFRSLPDDRRGVAPTLQGLSGRWAKDPRYAVKLASVANQIRTHDF
jgi:hypothetical protein